MEILDFFEYNGKNYIITPFAERGDLFEFVKSSGILSEWSAAYIMKQIFEGLCYLHNEKHIVHCDIKMENILITHAYIAKITDFGFAYDFANSISSQKKRHVVGTPAYLAPENWEGNYSTASDIWSAGILLCNLLFIKSPLHSDKKDIDHLKTIDNNKPDKFQVNDSQQILLKNLLETSSLSILCKEFITKLLHKNPEERITASESLNDPWIKKYSIAGIVK